MHKSDGELGFRNLYSFNMAMLTKQAWRLLTRPQSLVARLYKSRYFPNQSMYEAKLGSNPNYIWRSILGTLYAGARIRIGTGESVNVWRDPWVLDAHNPYVETISVEGLENATVSMLKSVEGPSWDDDLLRDISSTKGIHRRLIQQLPLSMREVRDSWMLAIAFLCWATWNYRNKMVL